MSIELCLTYGCVELDVRSVRIDVLNFELRELQRFEEMCDNAYSGHRISSLQRFLYNQCVDIYTKNTIRNFLKNGAKVIRSDIPIDELRW